MRINPHKKTPDAAACWPCARRFPMGDILRISKPVPAGIGAILLPPRQSLARSSLWRPIQRLNCVACRYLCRCRSASFLRRPRAAQSGLYLARLYFGVNTAPHSTQRFTSSRLLLISAHRAASSSELAMAKSVRKNAQPQIENLCSKGAWGRGPQQARGAIWIATSIACRFLREMKIASGEK